MKKKIAIIFGMFGLLVATLVFVPTTAKAELDPCGGAPCTHDVKECWLFGGTKCASTGSYCITKNGCQGQSY